MYLKAVLTSLIFLFAFLHRIVPITSIEIEPLDRWDDTEQALRDFVNEVRQSINTSLTSLDHLITGANSVSNQTLRDTQDILQDLEDEIIAEIDEIRSLANETTAITIERCITMYGREMTVLPIDISYRITDCVGENQNLSLSEVANATRQIQNSINMAGDLRNDIDGCRLVADSETCISRVFIEILIRTNEVPTNNAEITRRTNEVVELFIRQITYCMRDRINEAYLEKDILFGLLKTCAGISS